MLQQWFQIEPGEGRKGFYEIVSTTADSTNNSLVVCYDLLDINGPVTVRRGQQQQGGTRTRLLQYGCEYPLIASGFYNQVEAIEAIQLSPRFGKPAQRFQLGSLDPKYDHMVASEQ